MPFFKTIPPDQVRHYCENQSLDNLRKLNHRYGKFFEKIGDIEDRNNQKITQILVQISQIQEQIKENNQRVNDAEQSRRNILENLPEDPAERYLALQQVNYHIVDLSGSLEHEMTQLDIERTRLNSHNAWIRSEIRACIQELKILNAVIEEKEFADKLTLEQMFSK
jgi:predicted  nucleic acid-binding Zn-ribbon protein